MRIYVESNFVLELALQQEQYQACEYLLQRCESRQLKIAIPAYSLIEPFETLGRRKLQRRKLKDEIDGEFRQLARSSHHEAKLTGFSALTAILIDSASDEFDRVSDVRSRLVACADVLPLDQRVMRSAIQVQRSCQLGPQDAIVFASVVQDLKGRRSRGKCCFLNRNAKDFDAPDIRQKLEKLGCRLFPSFSGAAELLRGRGFE